MIAQHYIQSSEERLAELTNITIPESVIAWFEACHSADLYQLFPHMYCYVGEGFSFLVYAKKYGKESFLYFDTESLRVEIDITPLYEIGELYTRLDVAFRRMRALEMGACSHV